MPLDVMEVACVSKIFLAADMGRIGEFAGKSLTEITIDSNEEVIIESGECDEDKDDDNYDDDDDDEANDERKTACEDCFPNGDDPVVQMCR